MSFASCGTLDPLPVPQHPRPQALPIDDDTSLPHYLGKEERCLLRVLEGHKLYSQPELLGEARSERAASLPFSHAHEEVDVAVRMVVPPRTRAEEHGQRDRRFRSQGLAKAREKGPRPTEVSPLCQRELDRPRRRPLRAYEPLLECAPERPIGRLKLGSQLRERGSHYPTVAFGMSVNNLSYVRKATIVCPLPRSVLHELGSSSDSRKSGTRQLATLER